ncbi:alpha/beta hydrolase [Pseudomonas sp. CrR25]|nr:alpha/beta hydrolase [Pseudomonas sp. CrR25]
MTPTSEHPQLLQLADGRQLAYQCYGDPNGRPLYYFHGFPGSRLQAALHREQARAAGVCLVAADRPGFGHSSPSKARTLSDWPEDIRQLADRLGHKRFGVLGVSCGGPYALACASRLSERLDYVGLMAGMGPMDLPALRREQLPVLRLMFALARRHRLLASPLLLVDGLLFRRRPALAVKTLANLLAEPDRLLLETNRELSEGFAAFLAEAYRQGIGGSLTEAGLIAAPRGFALEDIDLPVHLYQSGLDRHVPPAMGRHMRDTLKHGHWYFYPQEGHLSVVVNQFPHVLEHFKGSTAGN